MYIYIYIYTHCPIFPLIVASHCVIALLAARMALVFGCVMDWLVEDEIQDLKKSPTHFKTQGGWISAIRCHDWEGCAALCVLRLCAGKVLG